MLGMNLERKSASWNGRGSTKHTPTHKKRPTEDRENGRFCYSCNGLITSNKSIRECPEMLAGDDALATAILDRLLHHCHVVRIDGRSYRLREMEKASAGK